MQGTLEGFVLKRKVSFDGEGASNANTSNKVPKSNSTPSMLKKIDINNLPWDPADRKNILDYDPNQRDEIRRIYLQRGPTQPRGHLFPIKKIASKDRRFVITWFDEYHWLEYSEKVDKAYCLWCYLFRDQVGRQRGSDAFVTDGFCNWNKKERFAVHEGDINSFHNRAHKNVKIS
ncbi:uncharacterized protein [Rutidosis leptorrhynchoides]|uniref:uncharacterized protein n=1 Tax=Rutidosis leptorrhynchoides TaxID=125765 RepID=UPI003A99478E